MCKIQSADPVRSDITLDSVKQAKTARVDTEAMRFIYVRSTNACMAAAQYQLKKEPAAVAVTLQHHLVHLQVASQA
jgi:hypothetical protein